MSTFLKDERMLDKVQVGAIPYKKLTKNGIPFVTSGTGFNLKFNIMPPGMNIIDSGNEPDDERIANIKPIGPILR